MKLQENNRSYEALTVGSLNVIGGIDNAGLNSIHTHLETIEGKQKKQLADI